MTRLAAAVCFVVFIGCGRQEAALPAVEEVSEEGPRPLAVSPGAWARVDGMKRGTKQHTSTALGDGRLLLVGGGEPGAVTSAAQLYDPHVDGWAMAGRLSVGRARHTATRLSDGRVLVAGGAAEKGASLRAVELFEPSSGSWAMGASLAEGRSSHTATLLMSGKVLVVGGSASTVGGSLATAELYDPATGSWSRAGLLRTARSGHSATLLPDGRVLVAGGTADRPLASAELYEPDTNSWSPVGAMAHPRASPLAVALSDGTVLVTSERTAELFNPGTRRFGETAGPSANHAFGGVARLSDDRVLVLGGEEGEQVELFEARNRAWKRLPGLDVGRRLCAVSVLEDRGVVVVTGGEGRGANGSFAANTAEAFALE